MRRVALSQGLVSLGEVATSHTGERPLRKFSERFGGLYGREGERGGRRGGANIFDSRGFSNRSSAQQEHHPNEIADTPSHDPSISLRYNTNPSFFMWGSTAVVPTYPQLNPREELWLATTKHHSEKAVELLRKGVPADWTGEAGDVC